MRLAFEERGLAPPDPHAVTSIIGLSLHEAIRHLHGEDAAVTEIASAYRRYWLQEEQRLSLFEGIPSMLQQLEDQGFWLGIVTGKSSAGLLRVLDFFDLKRHFLVWRTADRCPSKPHPAMVLECADELGVCPEHTVVIGDSPFDMAMAKAAGARPYGVSYGVGSTESLLREGAAAVFDHPQDITNVFVTAD